jgi:membrane associated rhomboid family serine protease
MSTNDLTNISAKETSDGSKILDAFFVSVFFLAICWSLFIMDEYLGYNVTQYGLFPREWSGLIGIFTMHFLHGSLSHIWHNTLAFLVLNSFLFYFYRSISIKTFFTIFLGSGILLWLIGRPSIHIGASLILYGEFAFLCFSGLIRRNPIMMRVALVVAMYYGSLVWYLFPIDPKISWEGHMAGFAAGIIAAIIYRKQGPQRKVFAFELEPDEEENLEDIPAGSENVSAENKSHNDSEKHMPSSSWQWTQSTTWDKNQKGPSS